MIPILFGASILLIFIPFDPALVTICTCLIPGGRVPIAPCLSPVPERTCPPPPAQTHGQPDVCPSPHEYGDPCSYRCHPGYTLPTTAAGGGTAGVAADASVYCTVRITSDTGLPMMQWDRQPTPCTGEYLSAPYALISVKFV